jgi:hypothetical protein
MTVNSKESCTAVPYLNKCNQISLQLDLKPHHTSKITTAREIFDVAPIYSYIHVLDLRLFRNGVASCSPFLESTLAVPSISDAKVDNSLSKLVHGAVWWGRWRLWKDHAQLVGKST